MENELNPSSKSYQGIRMSALRDDSAPPKTLDRNRNSKSFSIIAFASIGLILADQLAKTLAAGKLPLLPVPSDNFFDFEIYKNYGIAFGLPIPAGAFYFIVLIFLALVAHTKFWRFDNPGKSEIAAFSLVLAGAVGNLIDRLRWGYVLDFISVKGFLIFNLADAFIMIGVVLLLKDILKAER